MTEQKKHFAKITSSKSTYQVYYNQDLLLESNQVLELIEQNDGRVYPTVIYFPDTVISRLDTQPTTLVTHCPIKGDANYRSYERAENGIWSYDHPIGGVELLKDHVAFDQNKGFNVKLKTD